MRRIDHGVHSVDDPALIKHLEGTQLPLTVCPLSNQKVCVRSTMGTAASLVMLLLSTPRYEPSLCAMRSVRLLTAVARAGYLCALFNECKHVDTTHSGTPSGHLKLPYQHSTPLYCPAPALLECETVFGAAAAEGVRRQPARGEEAGRAAVPPLLRHLQQRRPRMCVSAHSKLTFIDLDLVLCMTLTQSQVCSPFCTQCAAAVPPFELLSALVCPQTSGAT